MYGDDMRDLRNRVGHHYGDFDWEYVFFGIKDISWCLKETLWHNQDPSVCLEGLDNVLVVPINEGPPPPRRNDLADFTDDLPCPEHLIINADEFFRAGYNSGTFRIYLRIRLSKCINQIRRVTILGHQPRLNKLGILSNHKRPRPKDAFNSFVDGINTSTQRPILFSIRTEDNMFGLELI
jgi:hypothetical protein